MSVQQYDEIGEAFEGFKSLPLTRYGEVPSFLAMVGDVRGKSVLDLASGTGFYSREFKRRGAAEVLGIDISGEMVAAAQKLEELDPLGVRYEVGDVSELRPLERHFDLAIGVQLLNYSRDMEDLERMCRNVHRSLVPGAEFFVLAQSPDYQPDAQSLEKYGFRCEPTGEEIETGPRFRVTALLDPPISIVSTALRREVYETCLRAAGFGEVTWVPLEVSDAGVREFGADFWADFRANPPLEMLRCRA
ncbi:MULTISPECIES: class I SAM-dependent methyltransferase [unclassified Streptomyces]|uniref:class I SAM-dependent methyltransferase n=1 Tax=unclassified Streptomyces TaxID=2593676 RepID=UPI0023661777|nr:MULTISPECIES: class I SAM-dependent methyltransferase [unclassified Streptomyces]MDF3144490.1 class I SAM-dependent methyltransferase [Streptomyces sp. T21Q-yed]WDF35352.1 class I SAM-dependent methyltransferase [Streptomyces sp. T12]